MWCCRGWSLVTDFSFSHLHIVLQAGLMQFRRVSTSLWHVYVNPVRAPKMNLTYPWEYHWDLTFFRWETILHLLFGKFKCQLIMWLWKTIIWLFFEQAYCADSSFPAALRQWLSDSCPSDMILFVFMIHESDV